MKSALGNVRLLDFLRRSVKRIGNAGIYFVASALARAGSIVLIPIYTHRFSNTEYGDYALAQTLIALLTDPLCLCLHQAVFRYYFDSEDREESARRSGSAARWLLVVTISLALILELVVVVARPTGSHGIYGRWELSCVLWAAAANAIGALPVVLLRAAQRATLAASLQLGQFFAGCGAGLLFVVVLNRGVRGGIEAVTVGALLNGGIGAAYILGAMKGSLDRAILRAALRFATPFIPHSIGNQLQAVSDRWVLKFSGNEAAVGIYSLASTLSIPTSMTIQAWHAASTPTIGEAARRKGLAAQATSYRRSYALVTGAAAIGTCILLPLVLPLIGKSFAGAFTVVPAICAILVIESQYDANSVLVFYADRPSVIPKITITAGVLSVLLGILLIPKLGIWGAVVARALSTSFRTAAMWYVARRYLALAPVTQ